MALQRPHNRELVKLLFQLGKQLVREPQIVVLLTKIQILGRAGVFFKVPRFDHAAQGDRGHRDVLDVDVHAHRVRPVLVRHHDVRGSAHARAPTRDHLLDQAELGQVADECADRRAAEVRAAASARRGSAPRRGGRG